MAADGSCLILETSETAICWMFYNVLIDTVCICMYYVCIMYVTYMLDLLVMPVRSIEELREHLDRIDSPTCCSWMPGMDRSTARPSTFFGNTKDTYGTRMEFCKSMPLSDTE